MIVLKFLKQLPVQLIFAIIAALAFGQMLDLSFVRFFYTVSACFIELLLFFLPVMVFSFIFRALISMQRGSLILLLLIFAGVTLSNCLALTVAYGCGQAFLPFLGIGPSTEFIAEFQAPVSAIFQLNLPNFIGTEKAMVAGVLLGIILSRLHPENQLREISERFSGFLNHTISQFLQKVFIPLLPLYVFGFCLKLSYEGALFMLFVHYGKVFLFSMFVVTMYLFILYMIGAMGDRKKAREYLQTMMPAGLTGFSTMSSAATMPVTLACVEKVTKDKNFTNLIIPSTANIHMLGDDLTIVITSMTILSVFGMPWLDWTSFLPFAIAFSLAKLSCVGVPGASVLVVLPVLQAYLGFTPEMVSILTTIYVLQDPFGTAANVMGNGAFALLIQRLFVKSKSLSTP